MKQSEFLHIVLPFKDKLYRVAKRLLVSSEEAEDATQEILMKLWNKRAQLSEVKNVEAFAMTMTKNYSFDRLKSKQASNLKLVHSNYAEKNTPLERQVEINDSVSIVHSLIAKLPKQQQMIIQLRDVEQYSFEEIGKMLDINETAVRVSLSRARKAIREQLTKTHRYGIS